jgi:hypothetical protein
MGIRSLLIDFAYVLEEDKEFPVETFVNYWFGEGATSTDLSGMLYKMAILDI